MSKPKGLGTAMMRQVASMDQLAAIQAALDDDSDLEDYVPPPRKVFVDSDDEDMMLDKGKDDQDSDDDNDNDTNKEKENQENVAKGEEGDAMDTEDADNAVKKKSPMASYKIGDMSGYYASNRKISVHDAPSVTTYRCDPGTTNAPCAVSVLEALQGVGDDVEELKMILGSDALVAKLISTTPTTPINGSDAYLSLQKYGGLLFLTASSVRDPQVSSLLFATLDKLILEVCEGTPRDVFCWNDYSYDRIEMCIWEYFNHSLVSMGFNYYTLANPFASGVKILRDIEDFSVLKLPQSVYNGVSGTDASISDRVMRYLPHSLLFYNGGGGSDDSALMYMQTLLLLSLEPSLNESCKSTIQETFHAWFHDSMQQEEGKTIYGEKVDFYQVGLNLLVKAMYKILENRQHEEVVSSMLDSSINVKQGSAILAASWLSMSDSPFMIKALAVFVDRLGKFGNEARFVEDKEDSTINVDKIMMSLLAEVNVSYQLKSGSEVLFEAADAMYMQSILTLTSAYLASLAKYPPSAANGKRGFFDYNDDPKQTMSKVGAKIAQAVDAIEEKIISHLAKNTDLTKQKNGMVLIDDIKKSVECINLVVGM